MSELIAVDIRTLMFVLLCGNLTLLILILAYSWSNKQVRGSLLIKYFIAARISFSISFFLLFFRARFNDFLTIGIANAALMIGFYLEALSLLNVIGCCTQVIYKIMRGILTVCLIGFYLLSYFFPQSNIYVATASVCIFAVLLIPDMLLVFAKDVNFFKRFIGIFYSFFLLLMPLRAVYALLNTDFGVSANFLIQTLTFMSMVLMMIYSSFATLILLREETEMRLNLMAMTDALTELSNRSSFLEKVEIYLEKGRKYGLPLTFLFLDIDHFKDINDKYGHSFGDTVLVSFAQTLRNNLREGDLCCRFGGEEFIIVLYGCDRQVSKGVAERIRKAISSSSFDNIADFSYTVSIGMNHGIPAEGETVKDFIDHADRALYQAKETGRNRTVEYKE